MQDLVLHKNDSFVFPSESMNNDLASLVQAYIFLFLTKIGSIQLEPTLGSVFSLGNKNIIDLNFMVTEINSDIFKQLNQYYPIREIKLLSLIDTNVKVGIISTYGTETVSLSI